ncbi:MAG: TldD/PmbA family protein, partial [Clostridia bacterium]|nr:TldD/PmbA family protein [Clostridia bacterium]
MDIKVFIDKLFARAKEVGFECCEAMIETSNNFTVGVLKGEIIQYKVSDSFGLGFRGLYGGKMGYATTQIADESAIDFLVNGAKNVAELIDSEDKVPLWAGSPSYPKMDLYSPALDEITAAEKIEMAKQLERETVAADPRVDRVERSIVYSAAGSTRIVNTLGLDVETTSNLLGGYVIAVATDGDDTQAGVEQFVARDREEIDLKGVAVRAAKNATTNLNADIPNSCNPAIILRWDAASEILETFSGIFNAEVAHKGLSLLKGREGEKIAADCFTLVDDPHMTRGMACQPFAGDGAATTVKPVIANGVLKPLLYTLKS